MENKFKRKLKRRGQEIYLRYFANPDNVINDIINQYDNKMLINEIDCEIIFNVPITYEKEIYELLLFYPNKLKELKIIGVNEIITLYDEYGETIDIMKTCRSGVSKTNARGKICANASSNSKKMGCFFNLISEDIKLVKICPILNIPLVYDNNIALDDSASIDKINPKLGYTKDNIQIISLLANKMKSSATKEQLICFAKKILELYKI
jgi:hypothetical protein